MPFATTRTSLRNLPLFFAYCPDRANALAKRLEVRPAHWERVRGEKEEGLFEFGLGYLPPRSSPLFSHPSLAPNQQPMAGSLLVFRAHSLDQAWTRIREDVYWTEGVWDRDTCRVEEFIKHEEYSD